MDELESKLKQLYTEEFYLIQQATYNMFQDGGIAEIQDEIKKVKKQIIEVKK